MVIPVMIGVSIIVFCLMRVFSPDPAPIVLGQHVRVGNEDNLWGADRKRKTTVEQIQGVVRLCKEFGRWVYYWPNGVKKEEGSFQAGRREGDGFVPIADRAVAIAFAVEIARTGDLVIVTGKGHEQSMCYGATEYPWDDHVAMRRALRARVVSAE